MTNEEIAKLRADAVYFSYLQPNGTAVYDTEEVNDFAKEVLEYLGGEEP